MKIRALHTSREWDAMRCGLLTERRTEWMRRARAYRMDPHRSSLAPMCVRAARETNHDYLVHLRRLTRGD